MAIKISGSTIIDDNRNISGALNLDATGVSTFTSLNTTNINATGITTSSGGFVGALTGDATGLSGTPNITVGNVTASNITGAAATFTNLTVNGTQTIINTQVLDVADKNIGIGSTSSPSDALADGAGITIYGTTNKTFIWKDDSDSFTFSEGIDIKGAVETVSVGATYDLGGGKVVLECDAKNGTVFTHNLSNGNVGVVSIRNFPVTKNSVTTFTILFTQAATAPTGGIGNTTVGTGIGTNITLTPLGVAGFTTSARVATASTVTLSTTANDIDIVSLAIHYNGSGTGTPDNYRTFASGNSGFRFGTVGF